MFRAPATPDRNLLMGRWSTRRCEGRSRNFGAGPACRVLSEEVKWNGFGESDVLGLRVTLQHVAESR